MEVAAPSTARTTLPAEAVTATLAILSYFHALPAAVDSPALPSVAPREPEGTPPVPWEAGWLAAGAARRNARDDSSF